MIVGQWLAWTARHRPCRRTREPCCASSCTPMSLGVGRSSGLWAAGRAAWTTGCWCIYASLYRALASFLTPKRLLQDTLDVKKLLFTLGADGQLGVCSASLCTASSTHMCTNH